MREKSIEVTVKRGAISFLVVFTAIFMLFGSVPLQAYDNAKHPILLIHGIGADTTSWKNLPTYLSNRGYDVFVMDWNDWNELSYAQRTEKNFKILAAVIARQTAKIREVTGKDKINIVAHSISGVAVRAYMAGWGSKIEPRGKYQGDINKVIYLSTPHYGIAKIDANLKKMMLETDYGKFMDRHTLADQLRVGNPDLLKLHDFFVGEGTDLGVNELTVYSQKDGIMSAHLTSLDGSRMNPFYVLRPAAYQAQVNASQHVNLKQFKHCTHRLIGNENKTILGVGATNHPTLKIVQSFFEGNTAYKKYHVKIKGRKNTLVLFRVSKSSGINMANVKPGAMVMKRIFPSKQKKVKMSYHAGSGVFLFEKQTTGLYELSYPPLAGYQVRFDLSMLQGTTHVATFDPLNLPFDSAYEVMEGDMGVKPGQIPATMNSYANLRKFVLAMFPFESRVYKSGANIKVLAKRVRQKLLQTYPSLINKNDVDKFGTDSLTTVDFVEGLNAEGVFANKLAWTEIKKKPPETGGGGEIPDFEYPTAAPTFVGSKSELRLFTLWHLREDAFRKYGEKKEPGARVRDKLASMYSHIARLNDDPLKNGYSAGYNSHRDAFYIWGDSKGYTGIIDFIAGSSAPGSLLHTNNPTGSGNLMWLHQEIPPW